VARSVGGNGCPERRLKEERVVTERFYQLSVRIASRAEGVKLCTLHSVELRGQTLHFALAPIRNAIQAAHVAPPAAGVTPSAVLLRDGLSLRSAHPPRFALRRNQPRETSRGGQVLMLNVGGSLALTTRNAQPGGTSRASTAPSLRAVTRPAVLLRGALSLRSAHRLRGKRCAANPSVR